MAAPPKKFKVCVCGGAGGIGQPLSMLMAMDEHVGELSVYDLSVSVVPAEGVAADLSHLERDCSVKSYSLDVSKGMKPVDHLEECFKDCHLVLIPAGVPRKPGMDRADLLNVNIGIAKDLVEACAKFCPKAIIGLIVNPVNSVVPAMAELYTQLSLDSKRICGVTTLDCVRSNKFVHEVTGVPSADINIPVVGGHAGVTILPLFSQDPAGRKVPEAKVKALDKRVQDAGTEVVNAKGGKGSATLSMAYAGARFGKAVLAGLAGDRRTECAYVKSNVVEGLDFFTSKVTFGPSGVEEVHPLGELTEYEKERLAEATKVLKEEIAAGKKAFAGLMSKI
uniref:Malate dehydrogenase n=1 Tax=Zooxanthella nutricula TaxID=1333877 RepID=A0A7S2QH20_9DINO